MDLSGGCRVGRLGVGGGVCAPCWWGNGLVVAKCGLWCQWVRNWVAVVLDGELESVNCSAGSVCLWCEWNANWVVVRCAGGTARGTACGLEVNASSMTALCGGWQFDAEVCPDWGGLRAKRGCGSSRSRERRLG